MKLKKILIIGAILIFITSVWTFIPSCGSERYAPDINDRFILTAARWVRFVEDEDIDEAKAITGGNTDDVIRTYQRELREIGTVVSRDLLQRNFIPVPGGNLNQIEFSLRIKPVVTDNHPRQTQRPRRELRISERIYVATDNNKNPRVFGTRFLVPLPSLQEGGEELDTESRSGNPVTVANQWLANYDARRFAPCSKCQTANNAFNSGMFFFTDQSLGIDHGMAETLARSFKSSGGRARNRQTVSRTIWHGCPGMSKVDIVRIVMTAEYPQGKRRETIWLFKDNFVPNRNWYVYRVHQGQLQPHKASPPKK
ncbi:MAG: hypothetical protein PHQ27_01100 [Victivallales bacterium]|nr:hypothetical protein [Victivallales bacterium]